MTKERVSHFSKKWLTLFVITAACAAAPRVSLEIAPAPAPLERGYADFWEAALALDYERAGLLATSEPQRDYSRALGALADGRIAEAQALLAGLAGDAQAAPRARALLAAVVKEGATIPDAAFSSRVDRSFVEALHEARSAERWIFPAEPVVLPFERGGSATPLVPVRVGGRDAVLGLDTGAGLTVIGSELAEAVGARRLGARTGARDAHGEGVQVELALVDLEIGAIRIQRHPVIVIDSARLRFKVAGIQIASFDGVLGWNAIAPLRITLDNAWKTIRFERSGGAVRGGGDLLWIGEPYVRARASNGLPLTLFLDTGASRTALSEPVAALAGLRSDERKSTLVMGAGSSRRMEVTVHRGAALHVGGARVAFDELQSMEPRSSGYAVRDGVLGADALRGGKVVLDPAAREFTISP
jgi:predicted aspartyl protease